MDPGDFPVPLDTWAVDASAGKYRVRCTKDVCEGATLRHCYEILCDTEDACLNLHFEDDRADIRGSQVDYSDYSNAKCTGTLELRVYGGAVPVVHSIRIERRTNYLPTKLT